MNKVKNVGRGILSLNLPTGGLHIAPKGIVELDDKEMNANEVKKHLAKKRLKIVDVKSAPRPSPKSSPKPIVSSIKSDSLDDEEKDDKSKESKKK